MLNTFGPHSSCRVRYAEVHGTNYAKGYVVPCYIEDNLPVFGKITDIVIIQSCICVFVLKPYISTTYNHHFHSFEVSLMDDIFFYEQNELVDFHPLFISKSYHSPSPLFVRYKYYLHP